MASFRFSLTPALIPRQTFGRADWSMPGSRSLPDDLRAEFRRRSVAAAVAEIAHEHGAGGVNLAAINRGARISKTTLYDLFPGGSREICTYACELAILCLVGRAREAAAEEEVGGQGTAAVAALVQAGVEEPLMCELALVHSTGLGPASPWSPMDQLVDELETLLGQGPGSELTAHTVVTALAAELRRPSPRWQSLGQTLRLLAGDGAPADHQAPPAAVSPTDSTIPARR